MKCVSCDKPLVCGKCGKAYTPSSESAYRAMHQAESAIACPACNAALVCRWCGHSYSGDAGEFGET